MLTTITKAVVNSAHIPLSLLTLLSAVPWPEQALVKDGDCYDYIVIGSGAGSIVANRLTEDPDISVLLVEAGYVPSLESMVPVLFVETQNSYQDWQYTSVKEPAAQSQSGDVFKVSVGKTLGGSSAINHFIYLRGDPSDYNYWADAVNDSSWRYENMLPYFKKSENMDDEEILNSEYGKFHSTSGPIVITREPKDKSKKYLEAFDEVGKKRTLDLNGNDTIGYAETTLSIGNKVRQSLAQAYISPITDRPNLYVSYKTLATKINFDDSKTATSVDMIIDDKKITVKAAREIILCAGVINSPKLLMLSGIGPKVHLESLDIPVIEDLPVGQNLKDHNSVQLVHKMEESLEISEIPTSTNLPFPVIVGFVNMNKSEPYAHYETMNLPFTHDLPYIILTCATLLGLKDEICQSFYDQSVSRNTLYTTLAHMQPRSTGEVKLRSRDPNDSPIILENIYSDERDLDDMVEFIADFIGIAKSKYFQDVNAELVKLDFEDCVGDFNDKDYIRCYAKHTAASIFHQCCTCAAGKVLDNRLRVKGVNRLRVVDASAFPSIPRANILSSVVILAEKASDMIKEDRCNLEPICVCKNGDSVSDSKMSFEKLIPDLF